MKVWYCWVSEMDGGWLVAVPTRGKARVLAADYMMLDGWPAQFLGVHTKVWDKEFDTDVARALEKEESVALGLEMLEDL